MKLTILAATIFCLSFRATADAPTEKVLDAFHKTFPLVDKVSWSESGHSYWADFTQNDVITKVNYDQKGNIITTFRYYYENNLPLMILGKLKKKFSGMKIFGVVEQSSEQGVIYQITLQGEKDWIIVQGTSSGNLDVEQKFNKP